MRAFDGNRFWANNDTGCGAHASFGVNFAEAVALAEKILRLLSNDILRCNLGEVNLLLIGMAWGKYFAGGLLGRFLGRSTWSWRVRRLRRARRIRAEIQDELPNSS